MTTQQIYCTIHHTSATKEGRHQEFNLQNESKGGSRVAYSKMKQSDRVFTFVLGFDTLVNLTEGIDWLVE